VAFIGHAEIALGGPSDDELRQGQARLSERLRVDLGSLDETLEKLDLDERERMSLVRSATSSLLLEISSYGTKRRSQIVEAFLNELRLAGRYIAVRDAAALAHEAAASPHIELPLSPGTIIHTLALLSGSKPFLDVDAFVDRFKMSTPAELLYTMNVTVKASHALLGTEFVMAHENQSIFHDEIALITRGDTMP